MHGARFECPLFIETFHVCISFLVINIVIGNGLTLFTFSQFHISNSSSLNNTVIEHQGILVFHVSVWEQLGTHECLDPLQHLNVVLSHDGYGSTSFPSSGSPAYSVYIVFTVLRHVKIQNQVHVWNIEATRCNVSGDHHLSFSAFKLVQGGKSLDLG